MTFKTLQKALELREVCPHLRVDILEWEGPLSKEGRGNEAIELYPICAHLQRMREEDPALGRQLGAFDSLCTVLSCHLDLTEENPWCPARYSYRALQEALRRALEKAYPILGRTRCEICGCPIVYGVVFDKHKGHPHCEKCAHALIEVGQEHVNLLDPLDRWVYAVYSKEDLERLR